MAEKDKDNIQVMVRVRPLNEREIKAGTKSCIEFFPEELNQITIDCKPEPKTFSFDYIGKSKTTQEEMFNQCGKPLTHVCLEGYNACIFAYGQTGAGKTYTMQGKGLETGSADASSRGLQPRVFDYLFWMMQHSLKEHLQEEYLVKCSYLEIYNEQIMDLLSSAGANLQVREDLNKGVYVEGLTEEIVRNGEETIGLLRKGARNRHVGSTYMNLESSRSHSVFSMTVENKKIVEGMRIVRVSKLNFVDLAGSERQGQTASAGDRLKEAGNINKSLTILGCVINSLVESSQGKSRHIPYRDSKLTFILKDSLGGNSRTTMIAAVSSASSSFQETLSTLKFAQRAKMIRNKALINEESSGSVEMLKLEVKRLKVELLEARTTINHLEFDRQTAENQYRLMATPKATSKLIGDILTGSVESYNHIHEEEKAMELEISIGSEERLLNAINSCLAKNLVMEEEIIKKLDVFEVSRYLFEQEIDKRDAEIFERNAWCSVWEKMELNYRMIIELKTSRERESMETESTDLNLGEENKKLREILAEIPYFSKMCDEINQLRASLIQHDGANYNIFNYFQEEIAEIRAWKRKFDDSLNDRKLLRNEIEKFEKSKNGTLLEEELNKLRAENNEKTDRLVSEISEWRRKYHDINRSLEDERHRNAELERDFAHSKKEAIQYEERIQELLARFHALEQSESENSNELERITTELRVENVELKDQNNSHRQKCQNQEEELKETRQRLDQTLEELEKIKTNHVAMLEERTKEYETFIVEKARFEDSIKHKDEEIQSLKVSSALKSDHEEELKSRIECLKADLKALKETYEMSTSNSTNQLMEIEKQLVNCKEELENSENSRLKIQEELDTLTQSYNYQAVELEEESSKTKKGKEMIRELKTELGELKERLKMQEKLTDMLKKQVESQNDENSPLNTTLRENEKLLEQNHELRKLVEKESNNLIDLRSQLHLITVQNSEVSQSEGHFRSALADLKKQFHELIGKNKELTVAIQARENELQELRSNSNYFQEQNRKGKNIIDRLKIEIRDERNGNNARHKTSVNEIKLLNDRLIYLEEKNREAEKLLNIRNEDLNYLSQRLKDMDERSSKGRTNFIENEEILRQPQNHSVNRRLFEDDNMNNLETNTSNVPDMIKGDHQAVNLPSSQFMNTPSVQLMNPSSVQLLNPPPAQLLNPSPAQLLNPANVQIMIPPSLQLMNPMNPQLINPMNPQLINPMNPQLINPINEKQHEMSNPSKLNQQPFLPPPMIGFPREVQNMPKNQMIPNVISRSNSNPSQGPVINYPNFQEFAKEEPNQSILNKLNSQTENEKEFTAFMNKHIDISADENDFADQVRKCRERFEEEKRNKIHEKYQKIISEKDEKLKLMERTVKEKDIQLQDAVDKLVMIQREVKNNIDSMSQVHDMKKLKSDNIKLREDLRNVHLERDNLLIDNKRATRDKQEILDKQIKMKAELDRLSKENNEYQLSAQIGMDPKFLFVNKLKEKNDYLLDENGRLQEELAKNENIITSLEDKIERMDRIPKKISPKSSNFNGSPQESGEKYLKSAISELADKSFKRILSINKLLGKNLPYQKEMSLYHIEQYFNVLANNLQEKTAQFRQISDILCEKELKTSALEKENQFLREKLENNLGVNNQFERKEQTDKENISNTENRINDPRLKKSNHNQFFKDDRNDIEYLGTYYQDYNVKKKKIN